MALARAMHELGHDVNVVCDCTARDIAGKFGVHTMRGERWRVVRRPLLFQTWAAATLEELAPEAIISTTPCVVPSGRRAIWMPGAAWGWRWIASERLRRGTFGAFQRTRAWYFNQWRAGARSARECRRRPGTLVVARDGEEAAAVARLTGHPRERIALAGFASGLDSGEPRDREANRIAVRGVLGIPIDARVVLASAVSDRSAAFRTAWNAVHRAAESQSDAPSTVLLLTGQRQIETLSLQPGRSRAVLIPAGHTLRWAELIDASDLALLPAPACGEHDASFIPDCLRRGVPVVCGRGVPGSASMAREHPDAVTIARAGDAAAVAEALGRQVEDGSQRLARAAAANASDLLGSESFAARLLGVLD